ncbi:neuropeptide Y receptor type 2-like [Stylophora pistillata]|uniref:neuropeptide Y receptor type 2-like n=1 Tax=Stylophora pistillata TaxID=50429 RepID=UPI000C049811|nr:neuropeptide Y receptor type 2-like [Stylophora pistillata]
MESFSFKIFKLFCYSLVFVFGVVGNVLVFRMVVKRRKLRTVSNIFICNLAAADIAVLTVNLPFRLAYQENSYIWPFGAVLCKTIPTLAYVFITASSMTLVIMTLDQYRAITKPLGRRFTVKTTKFAIVLSWTFSVLIALPFNFALRVVKRRDGQPVCTDAWPSDNFERFYFLCLFVVQFIIPMAIIVCCYTLICGHLNSKTRLDHLPRTLNKKRSDRNKKVIKMLVVVAAVYALFTLPYHVTWLFSVFGYPNSVAKKLCVLFVIATSAAHPIIYGTLNQEFNKGFKAFFRCLRQKEDDEYQMDNRIATRRLNEKCSHTYQVRGRDIRQGKQRENHEEVEAQLITCV